MKPTILRFDGAAGVAPAFEEFHLLVMENPEGDFANGEGFLHTGAAGIEFLSKKIVHQPPGFVVLRENLAENFFAENFVRTERGILLHRSGVCRSEGGFDIGEDVAEEIEPG